MRKKTILTVPGYHFCVEKILAKTLEYLAGMITIIHTLIHFDEEIKLTLGK